MQKLFDAIPKVVGPLDVNGEVSDAVVFAAWNNCAGQLITSRTSPVSFRSERLLIAVEDATWQRHLADLSPQMLIKLNHLLGQRAVRFVNFVVDPAAVLASRSPVNEPALSIDNDQFVPEPVSAVANKIANDELRRAFLSAAGDHFSKTKEKE